VQSVYVVKMLISAAGFILLSLGIVMYLYIAIRDRASRVQPFDRGPVEVGSSRVRSRI
jgi:hypothetical protein